ncbi:MAG: ABC transporter ATP-binding protein, partial [Anaerolineae bacterium]
FGPSGAGKSLTLAAIAGLLAPDMGRIAIGDRVLYDSAQGIALPSQARRLGLVRQDLALFPHLTVEQNIGYGLFRRPRSAARARVDEFLDLMGLASLRTRRPDALSGGQQQRVALARALVTQPSLLLLDEPFSALDQPTRMQLRADLQALQRRLETNLLFVTHDLSEACLLADYLAVVDRGRLAQFDTPEQVLRLPQTLRVAQVVGVQNILPGIILSPGVIRIGERELQVDTRGFLPGQPVYACLRPERITLVRKERALDELPNVMEGDFIGEESDAASVRLRLRARGPRLAPGQPFDLYIDTPMYVYERFNLAIDRHWAISIKPGTVHLLAE